MDSWAVPNAVFPKAVKELGVIREGSNRVSTVSNGSSAVILMKLNDVLVDLDG